MSDLYYNPPVAQPGAPVRANGGGGHQAIGYRSVLDARRSVGDGARVPSAEYPDGYLGTIQSRRDDRLLKAVQSRLTQRSYQRGVHKGERVDAGDYIWPADLNLMSGIEAQARGEKWTQQGTPEERLAHGGKVSAIRPQDILRLAQKYGLEVTDRTQIVNAQRKESLAKVLPRWK